MSLIQRGQGFLADAAVGVNSLTLEAAENANFSFDISGGSKYLCVLSEIESTDGTGIAGNASSSYHEFRINGGAWTDLTTTSAGVRVGSGYLCTSAESTPINDKLSTSTATFYNSGFDNDGAYSGRGLAANSHTELGSFTLFDNAQLSDGDTVEFRLKEATTRDNIVVVTISNSGSAATPYYYNQFVQGV